MKLNEKTLDYIIQLRADNEHLTDVRRKFYDENRALRTDLNVTKERVAELQQNLHEANERIGELTNEGIDMLRIYETSQNDLSTARHEIEVLKSQLKAAKK